MHRRLASPSKALLFPLRVISCLSWFSQSLAQRALRYLALWNPVFLFQHGQSSVLRNQFLATPPHPPDAPHMLQANREIHAMLALHIWFPQK